LQISWQAFLLPLLAIEMATKSMLLLKLRDPLRRLTPTPFISDLCVMGRRVRLESSSAKLLAEFTALFEPAADPSSTPPDFLWRIVGEAESGSNPPWPKMTAFSEEGLRYVNLGQRGFFAIDLDAREAVAFLSEGWASDSVGFSSVFAATLFDMTAPALGLAQIAAACVALHGKALLIFGPPGSGKTTATYLAGKLGLEFYSDQASFLDLRLGRLQVWGQFWPAAFREDTVQHLPELASATRSFSYGNLIFLCLFNRPIHPSLPRAALPVSCVFLEREETIVPQLIPMGPREREDRLSDSLSFRDDVRFRLQYEMALRSLGRLPMYRLPYGRDPAVAATFLRNILMIHESLEVGP